MRELGFFATIFGRNRNVKQCLLDSVTEACVTNSKAATHLEDVITARMAHQHGKAEETATVRPVRHKIGARPRKRKQ
jgi:hypothetical protein